MPGMRYVDHRKWDSRQFRDLTFSDIAEEKNFNMNEKNVLEVKEFNVNLYLNSKNKIRPS